MSKEAEKYFNKLSEELGYGELSRLQKERKQKMIKAVAGIIILFIATSLTFYWFGWKLWLIITLFIWSNNLSD